MYIHTHGLRHSADRLSGYTLQRRGVTRRCIGRFARDAYEKPAAAVRFDMVLHRTSRTRNLKHEM